MGDWPWKFHWLDGNRPDSLLLAVIEEVKLNLGAIGATGVIISAWLLRPKSNVSSNEQTLGDIPQYVTGDPAQIALDVSAKVAENGVDVLLESSCDGASAKLAAVEEELTKLTKQNQLLTAQIAEGEVNNSAFLATISHELRTPMNGIVGMSELLQASNLPARERSYANAIHSSAESLMHSVSDILDYSLLSSGKLTLEKTIFNLHECVEDVCEMLADAAHRRKNELVCDVDSDVPLMVEGDNHRIRQVLNHLLSNAIAFTSDGDVVVRLSSVSTKDKTHTLQCEVSDTGVGISPEMQMRLYEAFSSTSTSMKSKHEGLGIGLAVSSELVKAMNGSMTFKSRVGEGTTFIFTLDLIETPGVTSDEEMLPMLNGAKVFLVDDNDTNRTILNHQLNQWGVVTRSAASGKEALEFLRSEAEKGELFDALILDMHMPEMDGLTLAKLIHEDDSIPNMRAMLLTSAMIDASAEELMAIGIEKYISKPARQNLLRTSLLSLMPHGREHRVMESKQVVESVSYLPVNACVLLVEDNMVSQDVTVCLLESFGCDVTVVEDGQEAVKRCEEQRFDIVFMDCELPTISGFEATAAIRALSSSHSAVRIVAVTALAMAGDREKCLQSGMDDYLSKPLQKDQLYATVVRWCSDKLVVNNGDRSRAAANTVEVPEITLREDSVISSLATKADTSQSPNPIFQIPKDYTEIPTSGPVVKISALEAITALQRPGKEDLLEKVVGIYFEKSPALIAEMNACIENGTPSGVLAAAHSLKSSSAYLGADQLAALCKQIEHAADDKNDELIAKIAKRLTNGYTEVELFLRNYLDQRSKAA